MSAAIKLGIKDTTVVGIRWSGGIKDLDEIAELGCNDIDGRPQVNMQIWVFPLLIFRTKSSDIIYIARPGDWILCSEDGTVWTEPADDVKNKYIEVKNGN